jgi:uncharacterized membrane protein YbaN (DUF454 family)
VTPGRLVFGALGWLFVGLGVVGAFLPVLPTTPFLIVAVGCFARSSPRLEAWLLAHPRFGGSLRAWRERGAIPRRVKAFAVIGMVSGYAVFFLSVRPSLTLGLIVAAVMLAGAAYVLTRPD